MKVTKTHILVLKALDAVKSRDGDMIVLTLGGRNFFVPAYEAQVVLNLRISQTQIEDKIESAYALEGEKLVSFLEFLAENTKLIREKTKALKTEIQYLKSFMEGTSHF